MTTALCARNGRKSLLRLSDKFKAKYTLFMISNRGEVGFRAPEVEKAIPQRRRANHEPKQHSPTAVSQSEVDMIKHFLRTVCPPNTYRDSAVTSGITNKEAKGWIANVINDGGHGKLLEPAAKRMAFYLVREPHKLPVARGAFQFIVVVI